MDRFSAQDLQQLAQQPGDSDDAQCYCVSILLPMHRAGREVQQNELRFKNALSAARAQLAEADCPLSAVDTRLAPAEQLLQDAAYWQHQSDGLAVYIQGDSVKKFRLPCDFAEKVTVGKRFYIKPLTQILTDNHHWYILAASPNRVRLLRATMQDVEELQPDDFPENLRDALNIDEYVSALQFHSSGGRGRDAAIHHGQGGSDPDVKKQDEILQYFHRLDAAINSYFEDQSQPLIFAGVEYLFPIFKEASSYENTLSEAITGNPDDLTPAELQQKSVSLMEPRIRERQQAAMDDYGNRSTTDWASDDVVQLRKVAEMGQVETLCLDAAREQWALVDDQGELQMTDKSSANACELYNTIVVDTIVNGGSVVSIQASDSDDARVLPASGICAVFRSPAGSFADQA